jgi:hypothetical protein
MGLASAIDLNGATPVRKRTYSRADLLVVLDCSTEKLTRLLPELERRGFPRKIPGINKWSIAAVDDWLAHCGGAYTPFAERLADVAGDRDATLEAFYGDDAEREGALS